MREARKGGDFESGFQLALRRMLMDPAFLFRMERDPSGITPGTPYRLTDLELASRLSFFLWSSVPDDELLVRRSADSSGTRRSWSIRSGACWRTLAHKAW